MRSRKFGIPTVAGLVTSLSLGCQGDWCIGMEEPCVHPDQEGDCRDPIAGAWNLASSPLFLSADPDSCTDFGYSCSIAYVAQVVLDVGASLEARVHLLHRLAGRAYSVSKRYESHRAVVTMVRWMQYDIEFEDEDELPARLFCDVEDGAQTLTCRDEHCRDWVFELEPCYQEPDTT